MNSVAVAVPETHSNDRRNYWFDTKEIATFRRWLDQNPALLNTVGQFARFRVVVDANIVVQDLIHRVKYPERGNTALQELIQSTVIEAHAPRWLEQEITSAIPQAARRQVLPEQLLWDCWHQYKQVLIWDETLRDAPTSASVDPKDVPYAVLEKTIGALGILSHDRHFQKMGCNLLTFEFVLTMRNYARASVVDVGIRVSGAMVGTITISMIRTIISAIAAGINRLPPALRVALMMAAFIAIIHPGTRGWIAERWRSISPAATDLWNEIGPILVRLGQTAQAKRIEAEVHLAKALRSVPGA